MRVLFKVIAILAVIASALMLVLYRLGVVDIAPARKYVDCDGEAY